MLHVYGTGRATSIPRPFNTSLGTIQSSSSRLQPNSNLAWQTSSTLNKSRIAKANCNTSSRLLYCSSIYHAAIKGWCCFLSKYLQIEKNTNSPALLELYYTLVLCNELHTNVAPWTTLLMSAKMTMKSWVGHAGIQLGETRTHVTEPDAVRWPLLSQGNPRYDTKAIVMRGVSWPSAHFSTSLERLPA